METDDGCAEEQPRSHATPRPSRANRFPLVPVFCASGVRAKTKLAPGFSQAPHGEGPAGLCGLRLATGRAGLGFPHNGELHPFCPQTRAREGRPPGRGASANHSRLQRVPNISSSRGDGAERLQPRQCPRSPPLPGRPRVPGTPRPHLSRTL